MGVPKWKALPSRLTNGKPIICCLNPHCRAFTISISPPSHHPLVALEHNVDMSISEAEEEAQPPMKCVIEAIVRNAALEILKATGEVRYVVLLFSAVSLANTNRKQLSKPYGCTFLTCSETFGSKNDWKRHENSKHFPQETWRCDAEKVGGGACVKACYRRHSFQEHLKKDHDISDPEVLKTKVDACRIGRNCQVRFWCGFCNKLVDLINKGLEAWTERFDHIDDHFMGRHGLPKQSIRDWIPMDSDKPKGDAGSHALEYPQGHSDPNSNGNSSDSTLAGDDEEGAKRKRCKDDSGRNGPAKCPRKDTRSQSTVLFNM